MPTLPQKLEAIRQACIAANESILDLKFGCKIKITRRMDCEYAILYPEECWRVGDDVWTMCNLGARNDRKENYEIIGRDILLSDVLLAMNKKLDKWASRSWNSVIASWNLLRPSLEDQDEPTVNLIYEILCA